MKNWIIGIFVSLYFIVSIISMIHIVDFFQLTNPLWLSIGLAVSFEIGMMASLCSIIILEKINKTIVWGLFIILTLFSMFGNSYYSFVNIEEYSGFTELLGLGEEDPIFIKRILAILSGSLLPIVALGFIKSLMDYLKPSKQQFELPLPKEIDHSPEPIKITKINDLNSKLEQKEKELEKEELNKNIEQKMYDSMSNDDRQKILDFIKQKIDIVDENLKKEDIKIETPQSEKSNLQPKIEVIKEEPKKVEPQPEIKVSTPSGVKGSKWAGRNRPKSNPV